MKKTWIIRNLAVLFLIGGCDPKDDEPQQDDAQQDEPSDTEAMPDPDVEEPDEEDESTGTAPDDDEDDDEEDTEACSFLECNEPPGIGECDLWAQDCPMEGEKCMPWANDGGTAWNSSRCAPIAPTPDQPGDSCTVEGSGVSGIDSCALGSMCWDTNEEGVGTCVPLCTGSPEAPLCDDPTTACIIVNDGFLPLCLDSCDPLLGCSDGEACYPTPNGFACAPDASGPDQGGYGDPCEFINACDPGLFCANAPLVPGCTAGGCCSHFCDLSVPEPSADCGGVSEGQECLPFFAEGNETPGLEDLGICGIPE